MLYRIADLCVEMQPTYEKLRQRAEKYRVETDKPSLPVIVPPEEIESFREKSPLLHDDDREYLLAGSRFYTHMIMYDGMMLHSSAVVVDNEAYLFSAPCGTGKSTHTGLWLKHFGDRAYILNDDKPGIRVLNDGVYAYGTPFSGKYDISANEKVPIKGIAFLERSETNFVEKMPGNEVVFNFLNQTVRPATPALQVKMLETLNKVVTQIPIYKVHCNMDPEAAVVSYTAMQKGITHED